MGENCSSVPVWREMSCIGKTQPNPEIKYKVYNVPAKTFWSILIFNLEYKTVMSFDDYEIAVKKWSLKFLQGALQNKKKGKLSEILKYSKDTAIKVQFSSVYFPSLP